jgi:hypothetical protein
MSTTPATLPRASTSGRASAWNVPPLVLVAPGWAIHLAVAEAIGRLPQSDHTPGRML